MTGYYPSPKLPDPYEREKIQAMLRRNHSVKAISRYTGFSEKVVSLILSNMSTRTMEDRNHRAEVKREDIYRYKVRNEASASRDAARLGSRNLLVAINAYYQKYHAA